MFTSAILPYDIGKISYNYKLTIFLYEDVDPDILNDAVQNASTRYPYFKKRLVRLPQSYEIVDNDLPFVVYDNTDETRALNNESNNYHLLSVAYSGKSIDFASSHMLAGGCGLIEWVKTVLFLYLSKKHGVELHVNDIKLPGQEIPKEERLFITREIVDDVPDDDALNIESVSDAEDGRAPFAEYALGLAFPKLTKKLYYRFEFPQKEFMEKARKSDASPVALLSSVLFQALCKLWKHSTDNIQALIVHNYRAEVGLPETTCDLVRYIHVRYSDKLIDAPLDKICTVTRGQVLLQSDKAFALKDAKQVVERIEAVEALPTFDEKVKYCKKHDIFGERVLDSYQVSYVGRTDWGDMLPYLAGGDIVTEGELMLEVLSMGDRIYATLQEEMDRDKYKDAFVEALDAEGIAHTVSEPIEKRIPPIELPELSE